MLKHLLGGSTEKNLNIYLVGSGYFSAPETTVWTGWRWLVLRISSGAFHSPPDSLVLSTLWVWVCPRQHRCNPGGSALNGQVRCNRFVFPTGNSGKDIWNLLKDSRKLLGSISHQGQVILGILAVSNRSSEASAVVKAGNRTLRSEWETLVPNCSVERYAFRTDLVDTFVIQLAPVLWVRKEMDLNDWWLKELFLLRAFFFIFVLHDLTPFFAMSHLSRCDWICSFVLLSMILRIFPYFLLVCVCVCGVNLTSLELSLCWVNNFICQAWDVCSAFVSPVVYTERSVFLHRVTLTMQNG